ncbi:hypothetical protein VPH35_044769 [Triticum aestivum]
MLLYLYAGFDMPFVCVGRNSSSRSVLVDLTTLRRCSTKCKAREKLEMRHSFCNVMHLFREVILVLVPGDFSSATYGYLEPSTPPPADTTLGSGEYTGPLTAA